MPSRKELRVTLGHITSKPFAAQLPLHKTSYGDVEAAQITLQALISHHELLLVDEVLTKLNATTTNLNITLFYEFMRDAYQQRSKAEPTQKAIFMLVFDKTKGTYTIGRNQATKLLLQAVLEVTHV